MAEKGRFGQIHSRYEFAKTAVNLQGISAEKTDCDRCALWFAMTC